MQKDVHIVFGEVGKNLLTESRVFNLETSDLIVLYDLLSIGPLNDLDAEEEIQDRENYLSNLFGDLNFRNVNSIVRNDIKKLKGLIARSESLNAIYIWLGHRDNEIFGKARLIFHLAKTEAKFFVVDFPNIPVKTSLGKTIYPETLYHMSAENLKVIAKHFKKLGNEDLRHWSDVWERAIKEKTALLRLYNKEGEAIFTDETYFDDFLLAQCNNEFQKAARVIGYGICTLFLETNSDIGDVYMNHRLKQLALNKRLVHRGKLEEIRDYEVRLAI